MDRSFTAQKIKADVFEDDPDTFQPTEDIKHPEGVEEHQGGND